MKTLNIIIISIVAVAALLSSRVVYAQSVILTDNGQVIDCSKDALVMVDREVSLNTIVAEDYPFLKNVACLKNGYFSASRGLNFELKNVNHKNNATHFTVRGHGPNIRVEGRYDRDGNLVEAILVKKDTQIPTSIVRFILSDNEFKGWTMVSNEMVVKDFDSYQTAYKIVMSNGEKEKVLHFENQGGSIAYMNNK